VFMFSKLLYMRKCFKNRIKLFNRFKAVGLWLGGLTSSMFSSFFKTLVCNFFFVNILPTTIIFYLFWYLVVMRMDNLDSDMIFVDQPCICFFLPFLLCLQVVFFGLVYLMSCFSFSFPQMVIVLMSFED
jgi:hypothetical protein